MPYDLLCPVHHVADHATDHVEPDLSADGVANHLCTDHRRTNVDTDVSADHVKPDPSPDTDSDPESDVKPVTRPNYGPNLGTNVYSDLGPDNGPNVGPNCHPDRNAVGPPNPWSNSTRLHRRYVCRAVHRRVRLELAQRAVRVRTCHLGGGAWPGLRVRSNHLPFRRTVRCTHCDRRDCDPVAAVLADS